MSKEIERSLRAEQIASDIEAKIKGGNLNPDWVEAVLNPDNKAKVIELSCKISGYGSCTVSNGTVISLNRTDSGPSLCLGSRVALKAIGGRVRGFGASMIAKGGEKGVITRFDVIPPHNPTGNHCVTVAFDNGMVIRVFPESVELI